MAVQIATHWIILQLVLSAMLSATLAESIYRVDPLALLAATLRTYQRAGCDSEQLALSCPRGTSISIELAQYGRAGDLSDHSLCPPVSGEDTTVGSDAVVHSGTEIEVKPPESCTVQGLQYTLLQNVVEACQKKRHCKFSASPKTIDGDPCPGIRKFVEIAYKCRPYEFRSKVACENDNMQLVCNPYSRIAIYGASFGRTEYDSVQCSQTTEGKEESKQTCLVSYATETVMQICHGRRRCSLSADVATFGRPCKEDATMYLKVVYTCIPRKVLKDRYETAPENDEPQQTELDMDQDELYDEDQFYKESEAIPPAPKLQGGIPNPILPFDFGFGEITPTSTLMPPLLSRNDSSLEVTSIESTTIDFTTETATTTIDPIETTTPINVETTTPNPPLLSYLIPKYENGENIFGTTLAPARPPPPDTVHSNKLGNFIRTKKKFEKAPADEDNDENISINNCPCPDGSTSERIQVIGFLVNWMETYNYVAQNQERFYLYLIISVAAGVFLCLTLVIGRLIVHKRRVRKNSSASSTNTKSCDGKFQQSATGETHIPNGFGDDISDIDADIDLTTPLPVPSLSSRNETYMTYAPTPNCTYSMPPSSSSLSSTTTMMMPQSGMLVSGGMGHGGGGSNCVPGLGMGLGGGNSRQQTPPPNLLSGLGPMGPPVSGAMGPMMPSAISSLSHHAGVTPSYLAGTIMVPGHHHGTLRRTMIPTSMGILTGPSQPPPGAMAMGGMGPPPNVYYDGTMPRNLNRGMSADNAPQYFYG